MLRGIRGAITVKKNSVEEILSATEKLLKEIIKANSISIHDIASAFFTSTSDLDAEFPAKAARLMGWVNVPLLCACEISVPQSLKRCIRALILLNSDKQQKDIKNIYLEGAITLREDLEE
ncbi:chorismate mutase [Candidatus Saganbacteria bacterium]|nr:chorismate mutase [Candidatus Saganbacteria bacterium]